MMQRAMLLELFEKVKTTSASVAFLKRTNAAATLENAQIQDMEIQLMHEILPLKLHLRTVNMP